MGHHRFEPSEEHLRHHDICACSIDMSAFPEMDSRLLKEREVFIAELVENAYFKIPATEAPYHIKFGLHGTKLAIHATDKNNIEKINIFSLVPYRSLLAEYHDIKVTYQDIVTGLSSMQLETIDMARRGLHNEASESIRERLAGKIEIDFETGRKIFSLLSVLIRIKDF